MVNRKSVLYFKPSHVVVDNTKLISSISYHGSKSQLFGKRKNSVGHFSTTFEVSGIELIDSKISKEIITCCCSN